MDVLWEMQPPKAAYVHVPFCRRRCFYCDFPISVVGDNLVGESSGMMADYVAWLIREIELEPYKGAGLSSIFFGGGTPSLLSPGQISQILITLERRFGFESGIEISMEVDPGTFDLPRLNSWRSAGVNRFSLGVQAFQDELLEACGRSHRTKDVERSVALLRSTGNWSLDLMSGLPGQTLAMWLESLELAIEAGSTHLSVYDLTVEPGTVFGKLSDRDCLNVPLEEEVVEMYRMTAERLCAVGFDRYEVSSYARSVEFECRHNRVYWSGLPFYGFGMGATSFVDGVRLGRPRTRAEYFDWVGENEKKTVQDSVITQKNFEEREREIFLERVMMGLRLVKGIEVEPLVRRFGTALVDDAIVALQPFVISGLVIIKAGWIRLSEPEGLLLSNVVLVGLFEAIDRE